MVPMRSNLLLRAGPGVWGEARSLASRWLSASSGDGKSISREIIPYTEALQTIEVPRGNFCRIGDG